MKFIKDFISFINEGVSLLNPPTKTTGGNILEPGRVKINFENDPANPNELQTLEQGESRKTKGDKLRVIYAFESKEGEGKQAAIIKDVMDAFKGGGFFPDDMTQLEQVIASVIQNQVGGFDNISAIVKVGSRSPLVDFLAAVIYKNNPKVLISRVLKKEYQNVRAALNAVTIEALKQTDPKGSTKMRLDGFIKANADVSPFIITKSGKMPTSLRKYFLEKYAFDRTLTKKSVSLDQFGAPKENASFSDVCIQTLYNSHEKKVTLIVDDNIHTGTDMLEIVEAMQRVASNWVNTQVDAVSQEEREKLNREGRRALEKRREEARQFLLKYKEVYEKSAQDIVQYVAGFVAYSIKDSDLKDTIETRKEPAERVEKKHKRVTPRLVIDLFKKYRALQSEGDEAKLEPLDPSMSSEERKEKNKQRMQERFNVKNAEYARAFRQTLKEIDPSEADLLKKIKEQTKDDLGLRTSENQVGLTLGEFIRKNANLINSELNKEEIILNKEKSSGKRLSTLLPRIDPEPHIAEIMAAGTLDLPEKT